MPRAKNEWRQEPYPGHPLYHLKWTHGVWVASTVKLAELEHIHKQLHGPKPDGWADPNHTWDPDHTHYWPEQPKLATEDSGDSWEW